MMALAPATMVSRACFRAAASLERRVQSSVFETAAAAAPCEGSKSSLPYGSWKRPAGETVTRSDMSSPSLENCCSSTQERPLVYVDGSFELESRRGGREGAVQGRHEGWGRRRHWVASSSHVLSGATNRQNPKMTAAICMPVMTLPVLRERQQLEAEETAFAAEAAVLVRLLHPRPVPCPANWSRKPFDAISCLQPARGMPASIQRLHPAPQHCTDGGTDGCMAPNRGFTSLPSTGSSSGVGRRGLSSAASQGMADDVILQTRSMRQVQDAAGGEPSQTSVHEALQILEQAATSFFPEDSSSADVATAGAKVLLEQATVLIDRDNFSDAKKAIQRALRRSSASLEARVAAYESLAGLHLLLHEDEEAAAVAQEAVEVVGEMVGEPRSSDVSRVAGGGGGGGGGAAAAGYRAVCSLGLVQKLRGQEEEAFGAFQEASSLRERISSELLHGAASALVSEAQFLHSRGQIQGAKQLYEKVLRNEAGGMTAEGDEEGATAASTSSSAASPSASTAAEDDISKRPAVAVAGGAEAADEASVAALAGLGQIAAFEGDFSQAEDVLSAAIRRSERIGGVTHRRVGPLLSLLGVCFESRLRAEQSGQEMLAEALIARSLQYIAGIRPGDMPAEGKFVSRDLVAWNKAVFADMIRVYEPRRSEAHRCQQTAEKLWTGPVGLRDAVERGQPRGLRKDLVDGHRVTVIDVRHARVIV